MAETLTALDATLLELEQQDEGAVMNIGAVLVFDPADRRPVPTIDEVRALVSSRLSDLPRYRQRLSRARSGGWSWPQWVDDERFDLRNHVSRAALPAPGGDRELCDWIGAYYSHRLDRTRPLWEVVLLEGLEGGRWALAHKFHHSLVDETGSVGAVERLLDAMPIPGAEFPLGAAPEPNESLWRSLMPAVPAAVGQATRAWRHLAVSGVQMAVHPRQTLARSSLLAEFLLSDELFRAAPSSLNVATGSTRRYAAVQCALDDLIAIRKTLGGSVNDAALAACATALRQLLIAREEPLPRGGLRAMVPINLREASDSLPIGSLFIDLPVAEPDAGERHRQIASAAQHQETSRFWEAAGALIDLTAVAPPVVHASLVRALYGTRLFNLTIASVRGAQRPRFAFGARLTDVHPIVPLAAKHAVAIAVFLHEGVATFGISAESEATPDLDVLARGLQEGIDELLLLADGSRPAAAGDRIGSARVRSAVSNSTETKEP